MIHKHVHVCVYPIATCSCVHAICRHIGYMMCVGMLMITSGSGELQVNLHDAHTIWHASTSNLVTLC